MNKTFIAAAATSVLLLAGCASTTQTGSMSKLSDLSNQVSQLSQNVQSLQSDIRKSTDAAMSAREEAERANDRIDNIAQSYTK